MIPGDKPLPVRCYLLIDRSAEGFVYVYPRGGEVFIGHPWNHCGDGSGPFIEVKKDGHTIRTVNCTDISIIGFAESEGE